ncbi:MAG: hypothetical protein Q8858_12800, partial [Bacteroidota bacterium]|nr:hypothetical protein [Bacteroidota bacterium]
MNLKVLYHKKVTTKGQKMNSFANMKTLPKLQIGFFFLAFLGLIAGHLLISYSDTFAHNIPLMILLEIILSIVATVIFGIISKKVISKPINDITAVAEKIAKGILNNTADAKSQDPDSYNGEFSELHDKLALIKESIHNIITDSSSLSAAVTAGKLNVRADVSKYNGEYKKIIQCFNTTLDKVAEKTEWYEAIIDAVPFPIHVTDNDMNWTFMNKPFEKLLIEQKYINNRKDSMGKQCSNANANICNT